MKHIANLFVGIIFCLLIISCAERAVCPAYQSAFIHDKAALDRHFSYFGEDSLPKSYLTASKDRFLIIEKVPYKKKLRSLNTVPARTVYPVLEQDSLLVTDSTGVQLDAGMMSELDVVDSLALDSAIAEYPWQEKFNVEQEFYFHYFNEILVYPMERLEAEMEQKNKKGVETSATQLDKKKQPFFKRVFGGLFKKDKSADEVSEEDTSDENVDESPKKKGLFGKKIKANQDDEIIDETEEDPVPVTEEDDTGEDDF